jgi:putative transposase
MTRLACVFEEYGIELEADGEEWTSQECPHCGDRDETVRHGDTLTCPCEFDGHADLTASRTFLHRQLDDAQVGLIAQPVHLKWDDHEWLEVSHSPRPNEVRANPQVAFAGESA